MKQLHTYFIKLIYFLLLQFIVSTLPAQQTIQFNHFSAAHGLSQNNFQSILQDKKGYMWFASSNGLIKYDGYAFKTFHHEPGNKNSLPDNYMKQLCEDSKGNIWIISGDIVKLTKYNPQTGKFTTYHHDEKDKYSLSSDAVNCIVAGQNGSLWIGTNNAGLCRYDPATDHFIDYGKNQMLPDTLCSKTIFSLLIDHKGSLWIGTNKGVNVFNPIHNTLMAYKPEDQNKFARYSFTNYLFEDHAGNIWIGYIDGNGVTRLNPTTGMVSHYLHPGNNPNSISWNVNSIMEDHNNTIWIASYNGLSAYQPQTGDFKVYLADTKDKNTLGSNSVMKIYEDRSGVLWIATNGGGLNTLELSNKKFQVYQQRFNKDYATNYPMGLNKNHEGNILINTFGAGVQVFDPATDEFKSYQFDKAKNKGHNFNYSYCTLEDSNGMLWVGTSTEGLHTLDLKTGIFNTWHSNSNNADTVAYNQINCMAEDQTKQLWLGTQTGLKCFNLKTKTYQDFQKLYPDSNQLAEDAITDLFCDPQGILWIGGTIGGLTLFNTKTGETQIFKQDDKNLHSISNNVINCFYDDGKGIVWIGTSSGLNGFDKKTKQFVSYTTLNGLPGNSVTGIVADNNGNLWLSGDEGICRFTAPSFTNSKAICRNYNVSDGLPGNEYYFNTCVKGDDGTLYFGSNAGIVAFKPDDLKDNSFIPPVLITDLSVFNKPVTTNDSTGILKLPVDETKEIKLSYRQNNFTFTFAALSFIHPEKNQYAYKLEDYDKEWIYTDASKRYVNYTNLDPGEYIFQVKASNNDGIWNETPTKIHLIITPPFWQTWWFRTLILLSVGSMVYGIYRFRLREVMRLQNIRNKISGDLHDDIGSTLNSISVYSEVAK
ncbi:MAG: two-component regulator propeller domain-containing protein, partial [Ferruginibacter sp.]